MTPLAPGDRVRHIKTGWTGTVTRAPFTYRVSGGTVEAVGVQWNGYFETVRALTRALERVAPPLAVGDRVRHTGTGWTGTVTKLGKFSDDVIVKWDTFFKAEVALTRALERITP